MKIERITVVESQFDLDQVFFRTDIVSARHPYKEKAILRTEAAQGAGVAWVEKNFPGIVVEVVKKGN